MFQTLTGQPTVPELMEPVCLACNRSKTLHKYSVCQEDGSTWIGVNPEHDSAVGAENRSKLVVDRSAAPGKYNEHIYCSASMQNTAQGRTGGVVPPGNLRDVSFSYGLKLPPIISAAFYFLKVSITHLSIYFKNRMKKCFPNIYHLALDY